MIAILGLVYFLILVSFIYQGFGFCFDENVFFFLLWCVITLPTLWVILLTMSVVSSGFWCVVSFLQFVVSTISIDKKPIVLLWQKVILWVKNVCFTITQSLLFNSTLYFVYL